MFHKRLRLKEGYRAARCCASEPHDAITGYHSYNNLIAVHRASCENLQKNESERLITIHWMDILDREEHRPGRDCHQLDQVDFRILQHHKNMGIDYSQMVARILNLTSEQAFERHKRLSHLKLLKRVEKGMIQYRKKVVHSKWIKHRNHTYYQITPKGEKYLEFYVSEKGKRS